MILHPTHVKEKYYELQLVEAELLKENFMHRKFD
jgi:hypothetical protein